MFDTFVYFTYYCIQMTDMLKKASYRCAVEITVEIAGGKWKPLIIYYLLTGTKRFGELKRLIGGVTQRSLTLQLRQLENNGLIIRTVFPEVPPRVEYTLTPKGESLSPVLKAMKEWGESLL